MKKKMIAPIIITTIAIIYFIFYFAVIITFVDIVGAILFGIIPLAGAGVMIYVCVQRIKEIRSGEEDDLGKY